MDYMDSVCQKAVGILNRSISGLRIRSLHRFEIIIRVSGTCLDCSAMCIVLRNRCAALGTACNGGNDGRQMDGEGRG